MSLLAVNFRRLNIYTKLLRTLPVSSIYSRHAAYDSIKFPEYKVVYVLDRVTKVSTINRLKYRISIGTAIIIPGIYGLLNTHVINYDAFAVLFFYTLTTAVFFHIIGIFCNNVIGYIYANEKTNELIISYVDFWGKRIDINAKYADISIKDSNNFLIKSIFNDFKIESHKKSLKFYIKGKVLDDKIFDKICGITFQ